MNGLIYEYVGMSRPRWRLTRRYYGRIVAAWTRLHG
jgi:hypothetical protein